VVVLGVSVDTNRELYQRFIDQFGVTFETARDPEWDIAARYGTFQLPETYIIDRSGRVVQKVIAAQNWMNPQFLESVRKLL
jgi:peroxiredoxin